MIRKEAIPLIENAITTGVWRKYMNPILWKYPVNFPDSLLERLNDAIPDFMDRMQALATTTKDYVDSSPIELIHAPTNPNAMMGQVEVMLTEPVKVSFCVVFYEDEFWVQEKEFFAFDIEPENKNTDADAATDNGGIASQIHYYDVEHSIPDKGWLHYTSRVPGWEGVDARVADIVRSVEDVSADTLGFLPNQVPTDRPTPQIVRLLAEEAVRVSQFGPTWLDRIMTNSPLRDRDLWRSEQKAIYFRQRRQRRKKFVSGSLAFVIPNAKQGD